MTMLEYIVNNGAWSLIGYGLGWFTCSRWKRLETRIDKIDKQMEKGNDDT